MNLDIKEYLPFLGHCDWSLEEKEEIIRMVWRMMEAEADKAFGLDPVQLSCKQSKNTSSQTLPSTVDSMIKVASSPIDDAANDNTLLTKGGQNVA